MSGKYNAQWSHILKNTFVHLTSKLTSGRNQPRVACVSWTVSPDINWAQCEAEHSVQSSAQFKKPPWNAQRRQHLPLYLHFVSQEAGITDLYECPSPITFSSSILLNALGTVVCIVNKLWAWWSMVWFPVWARDSCLKTRSVDHKASYSMATTGFWTFSLLALRLRISWDKTLHPLLALFCCQLCEKPDP